MASTWSDILNQFMSEQQRPGAPGETAPWARVLNRCIAEVKGITNRPLLVYASACTTSGKRYPPEHLQIDPSDKIGFHDVLERLPGPNVDILIHSPGGFAEATETIVEEIRQKYNNVRFIVPSFAKSAATMMVMSGDEILLDEAAELGPIDPQMRTANGVAPAEAIKEQFLKASAEITSDPKKLSIWIPILQPMGPALLVQCDNAIKLSKQLVEDWLTNYMFRAVQNGRERAKLIANYLGSHANFMSHGRRVRLVDLTKPEFGLAIRNLRDDAALYAAVWKTYCALDITFANMPIYKIFCNSALDSMIRHAPQQPAIQFLGGGPMPGLPIPLPGAPARPRS
jgi:serine dehydrogenase proteinase